MDGEREKFPFAVALRFLGFPLCQVSKRDPLGYKTGKGYKECAVIGIQAVFSQPDNAVAQVGYRRSVNMSVVAVFHQGIFRPLESIGVHIGKEGFKLLQVAFRCRTSLDKGGRRSRRDGHRVRRADFKYVFSRTSGNCMETACSTCFRVIGLSA